jgi:hypothetical protein
VVDSIGIEAGDSNYVFNAIERVSIDHDGSILVLDRVGCRVSRYTPGGEFVESAGRRGSGPGEYMNPSDLIVLGDGRMMVCDIFTGGVHLLDSAMVDQGVRIPFASDPPFFPAPALDSSFVAASYTLDMSGDELAMDYYIARFDMSSEPSVRYVEEVITIDPTDVTSIVDILLYHACWAVDDEGDVFVAPMSPDIYEITGFRTDGTEFLSISVPVERVARTEEEIALEEAFVENKMVSVGSSLPPDYNPSPWRYQIRQIEVDGEGDIWVLRGTVDTPTFDVYDQTGGYLHTVRVAGAGEDGAWWRFAIGVSGIAAWSEDPPDYGRVFILAE